LVGGMASILFSTAALELGVLSMRKMRKAGGSQIAELAPSLIILLLVILFPMIDIIYLGVGYCSGMYLNQMTTRACSTSKPSDWAAARNAMNSAWLSSSLPHFTGSSIIKNDFKAPQTLAGGDEFDQFVEVNTQVQVSPFISLASVPFLSALSIDGLTKPVVFNYIDKRPMEETGKN